MILQIIDKNPVKIVTNEKIKKEFWQDIRKYYMNPLETFDLIINPGKEQWGLDLILYSSYGRSLARLNPPILPVSLTSQYFNEQ